MLVPWLTSFDGLIRLPLYAVGPYGAWADLQFTTRWGDGASGMYEARWTMPLPADFQDPLTRRGSLVEIMDGPCRVGSPLILTEPTRGSGIDQPWQFTATGIGRDVEGENSFYAADGSGNATTVPTTAVAQAITDGWRIGGADSSVTATSPSAASTSENLNTVGELLSAAAQAASKRWTVKSDNLLYFVSDPTTPTWQTTPTVGAPGVADDDYASTVKGRYLDSSTGTYLTRTSTSTSGVATQYGVRQYAIDFTDRGPVSSSTAQTWTDGALAMLKGRLGWTNGLSLTSNQLLNMGGMPADLTMVEAGQMLRIQGVFNDLLAYNGQTYLDVIIGETSYTDGAQTVDIKPLGFAARDLASIMERASA